MALWSRIRGSWTILTFAERRRRSAFGVLRRDSVIRGTRDLVLIPCRGIPRDGQRFGNLDTSVRYPRGHLCYIVGINRLGV